MIAALFVAKDGCYFGLDGVDPWPESRDARKYAGPWPVVAHPPCARWCRLAGLVEARWGHKRGEDGGCFAAALAAVRRFGGVLEHPAYSDAWAAFDLPRPPTGGGWVRGMCGGWSCHVEQGHYGHRARKATWLYAFGVDLPDVARGPCKRPSWNELGASGKRVWCTPCASPGVARWRVVETMSKRERLATPVQFRDLLIGIARSVRREAVGIREGVLRD